MAYALIGSGHSGQNYAGTISISATYAAGETVLVVVGNITTGTLTISDGTNTYSSVASITNWQSCGAIFKADNVAAGTFTVSCANASCTSIAYFRYTGLASGAVEGFATNPQNGPGPATDAATSGNITPSAQPAMLFGVLIDQNGNLGTAGTGFTDRGPLTSTAANAALSVEDRRITALTPVPATWTVTSFQFDNVSTLGVVIAEGTFVPDTTGMLMLLC